MFSSSFTMSEQKHRKWTPYKHAAPALTGRSALARPAARSVRASRNLRTALQFECERAARKKLRADESKAQHALPDDGRRAQNEQGGS
jgi:hypothetical protein